MQISIVKREEAGNWSAARGRTSCMPIYACPRPRKRKRRHRGPGRGRTKRRAQRKKKKEPWRARRALGVNEGRSCDRPIFPKRQGGPIRRHVKAGRIISNLYCRGIRLHSEQRTRLLLFPIGRALSVLFLPLLRSTRTRCRPVPSPSRLIPVSPAGTTLRNNFIRETRPAEWYEHTWESGARDGTRLSYAIANYRQFDPVITQFQVIGPYS